MRETFLAETMNTIENYVNQTLTEFGIVGEKARSFGPWNTFLITYQRHRRGEKADGIRVHNIYECLKHIPV